MSPVQHYSAMDTFLGSAPALDQYNRIQQLAATFRHVTKTASYTCLQEDSGTIFDNAGAAGAVTFTLPAVASSEGVFYMFSGRVDQNLVITAPSGTLVHTNSAASTSATFSTTSQKIGCAALAYCDGTKWIVFNLNGACTVTLS